MQDGIFWLGITRVWAQWNRKEEVMVVKLSLSGGYLREVGILGRIQTEIEFSHCKEILLKLISPVKLNM